MRISNLIILISASFILMNSVNAKPLRVGVMHFPPFLVVSDEGTGGTELSKLEAALKKTGHSYTVKGYPIKRLYHNIANNNVDIILNSKKNKAFQDKVFHSEKPVKTIKANIYSLKQTSLPKNQKDWVGKSFIVIKGFNYGGLINVLRNHEQKKNVKIFQSRMHLPAFRMLKEKRADYVLDYHEPSIDAIRQTKADIQYANLFSVDVYIIVNKKVPNAKKLVKQLASVY